jgi:hypothetical protein
MPGADVVPVQGVKRARPQVLEIDRLAGDQAETRQYLAERCRLPQGHDLRSSPSDEIGRRLIRVSSVGGPEGEVSIGAQRRAHAGEGCWASGFTLRRLAFQGCRVRRCLAAIARLRAVVK